MRRESGEILVVQEMKIVDGKYPPPHALIAGDHIDLAVNPKNGGLVYCVTHFQWPDAASAAPGPDGKAPKKPFVNAVGTFDFSGKNTILAANNGELNFGSPAISLDGVSLAVVLSKTQNGDTTPVGLVTMPTSEDPNFKRKQFGGDIHEPSWAPDGAHILVAVRRPGKPRTIFEIPIDGSPPRDVTGDLGDFGFPKYSPQVKAN
jgi:hypothetical protein